MVEWHCSVGGQQYGPVGDDELRAWAAEGRLKPTDLVWTEGMAEWAPAGSVGGLFAATASPVAAAQTITSFAQPHRGGAILALGIISIVVGFVCAPAGLVCGVIAWVMGNKDMPRIRSGRMDPSGEGITQGGRICGIIGTIISILMLLYWLYLIAMWARIMRQL